MFVKTRGSWVRLKFDDIDMVVAEQNATRIQAGAEKFHVRDALIALLPKLPGQRFVQINRGAIVNVDRIKAIHSKSHGDAIAELENGERQIITRRFRPKLKFLFAEEPTRTSLAAVSQ